ncbi:MAG TPA: DsrE/DsrF/DrsH-like family protein [Candidatus Methylomirabilis sp.]|nr:DsrE/DsrF/DrsH-like family protein [Candidatus Methylomirabilis sp.]
MSDERVLPEVTRTDFLKLAGIAALLPLIGSVTPASAAEGKERLYVVTHAADDVDRAALALLLSGIDAKKIGKEFPAVTIWFTLQGAKLCRKGSAEKLTSPVFKKFGTLAEILGVAVKAGAKVAACPFCIDFFEIRKEEYLDGLERKGGDYVAAQVGKVDVIWM